MGLKARLTCHSCIAAHADVWCCAGAAGGQCPPHPGFVFGLCMRCGAEQPQHGDGYVSSSLALRYMHRTLQVSPEEAERLRQAAVELLSYEAGVCHFDSSAVVSEGSWHVWH